MTLACGLIWVGYQKRMSCITVLTALTSPVMLTSAVQAVKLNHNIIYSYHGIEAGGVNTPWMLNVNDSTQGTKSTSV